MARRGRPKPPDILTPREWDVLALLREGCTNEQIAERLRISLRTARFHVSEILGKLEVTSRAEAAAWQPEATLTPAPERRLALVAPLAFGRRLGALGAGARIAASGVLAVAAVGVGLLAWGVMRTGGSGGPAANSTENGTAALATLACETPAAVPDGAPVVELGSAPIFWRFGGLTEQDLTSGHYCGRGFKISFRVTNVGTCSEVAPVTGVTLEAGNTTTGEHLTEPLTCVGAGNDLPGAYFSTSFELPQPGEWLLRLTAGPDTSTQVVRIGGAPPTPLRVLADPVVLAAINADSGALDLLDPASRRSLGKITAGYRPWIAVRATAHQLLVAQTFGPGADVNTPTLRVYDLRDLAAAPSVIPMPNRAVSTVYAPSIVLSDDERYVFFGAITPPGPACNGDATLCQHASVGVIDMQQSRVVADAALPAGCTYPEVHRAPGYNEALVMCAAPRDIELTLVSPDGSAKPAGTFGLRRRPSNRGPIREVDVGNNAQGNYYVVYTDGIVSGIGMPDVALAGSNAISVFAAQEMPGGQHLLAYNRNQTTDVTGVIVYDPADPSNFRRFPLDRTWSGAAPLSATSVALLDGSTLGVLDLTTGKVTTQTLDLAGSPEFLASG